ncbi:Fe-S type, tartrate/fumarate subfamily hydro-lyase subunit alpha [Candidatus Magnetoovum chiemensis]|nr:Fe-S type, tartrate/fumarate subfamily hydro-lyase subunit alpha [Candidatus Magnetoovum chiemensis]
MLKLRDGIVELYKKVATSIPPDVEKSLKDALNKEKYGTKGYDTLNIILENIKQARSTKRPVCQDTGVPTFWVKVPKGLSHKDIKEIIIEGTRLATAKIPLRSNAVEPISEINSGDNTGEGFPIIHLEESQELSLVVDLMLKGAGCENAGQIYKLPDAELEAHRDFEGVRKCIIDTVLKAQGKACPPYTFAAAVGASRDQVTSLSKKQLLRRLSDKNPNPYIEKLETRLLNDINALGIGPIGLGGKITCLGVKIGVNHRHPASFFVDVTVSCWALRRGRLIWS